VKYWPNEFGTNAKSNDIDYVSFFAYAPYVDFNPMTGVAPAGDDAAQQQWKNITSASRNGDLGDPLIRYMVDTNPQTSVDLLWGVAANKNFQGLAPAATTTQLKEGGCYLNLSKQVGVDDKIEWRFHHALSKLKVEIIAASDIATEGTAEYVAADGATAIDDATRVYLRWIEFQGFAMSGALNLNSATPLTGTVPTAKWMSYDGATDLKITTVRFNDGLFDGKEGIADNVNPNERVLGELNDTIIEKSTPAGGWQAKNAGIPTAKYTNLFANAKNGKDCIYVIPTSSPVKISMLYDIETADKRVGKYLSDGTTTGVRIANEISKNLDGLKFEAGKAYNIKIVVGLESVKVTAEVVDWPEAGQIVDVDMPYNLSASTQAMVNGKPYASLAAAISAAAEAGVDVVTMPQDVTLTETMNLDFAGKNITLDLGGNTLSGRTNLKGGNLTITNGTVDGKEGQALNVYGSSTPGSENYSVLNIASDVTVKGKWGVCMFGEQASGNGYGSVINIEGTVIDSGNGAVWVSGNLGNNIEEDMHNIINITGTVISNNDAGIALNGNATVNVLEGASITGNTAATIKRGVLNVSGGTIHSTGDAIIPPTTYNTNGTEMTGAGISMTSTYNGYGSMSVNITGGTITTSDPNAPALYKWEYTNKPYVNDATIEVSGGTFSSDPSAYVVSGKSATESGGMWTVQ
jgi:hypothetical protein